jgi:hypothetical protein
MVLDCTEVQFVLVNREARTIQLVEFVQFALDKDQFLAAFCLINYTDRNCVGRRYR